MLQGLETLPNLAHTSWLGETERIVARYGWSVENGTTFDPVLLAAILEGVDKWRRTDDQGKTFEAAESFIKTPCQNFIDSHIFEGLGNIDYILDPALLVAADATVTCTAFFESGCRFIKPLDDETIQFADQTVVHVLSDGLEVSDFRKRAFKQLLPGLDTWHDGDLVAARDGYVAGMDMLWTESPLQSDALRIRVQRGQIKKDQVSYTTIRENPFNSITFAGPRVPAFDAVNGLILPEVGWQHPIKDRAYSFETSASSHGTRIEVKHYMTYANNLGKSVSRRKASWICAIGVLATATHMDLESQMTAFLNRSLAVRLTQQLLAKDVCWVEPFSAPKMDRGARTLMRTGTDRKVKIFGAGVCNEVRETCCHIIIRHRSPLLQCIERAESKMGQNEMSWVIVD